ncbi:hypothetical protein ILUMI_20059 [Ignelater luminosus]|uniref:Tc1-like transposase DDE domain-containing protein n=1 Tax=Ignelater luminosus TaxID=2038154 RepID=A0A8K0CH20_IGNLU|nr:hypothetical protein ILUMI_20059 [Ignelater luminosus]
MAKHREIAIKIRNLIITYHKSGGLMLWGSMAWEGCGELEFIEGIMTKEGYLHILDTKLFQCANKLNFGTEFIFQQDRDSKHTAKVVQEWFSSNGIEVLEWPAQSPDLNLIRYL